jgi:hypothetical protein
MFRYVEQTLLVGGSLDSLVQNCEVFAREAQRLEQAKIHLDMLVSWQCVLNLLGESDDPLILKGAVVDQDRALKAAMDPM